MLIENLELRRKVINIASVPHRSPFRYPGGKTWFIPTLRRWLANKNKPELFLEPFAGGAIVGLTVAFEKLAQKVILVELDEDVAAVWQTVLSEDNSKLVRHLLNFSLTKTNVVNELNRTPKSTFHRAFQTILRNRVSHAGIMAPGSGLIKNGENGKGIASRWYPETLAKRIQDIYSIKDTLRFIHGSAFDVIPKHTSSGKNAIFIDPPYTAFGKRAGTRLYRYNQLDHKLLFGLFNKSKADFIFTYDDTTEVRELAKNMKYEASLIAMKNSHHAKMKELLIGKDLTWLRNN